MNPVSSHPRRRLAMAAALTVVATIAVASPAAADGPDYDGPSVTDPYIRSLVPNDLRADTGETRVSDPYIRSLVPNDLRADTGEARVTDPYIRSLVPNDLPVVISIPQSVAVPTGGGVDRTEAIVAGVVGLVVGMFLMGAGALALRIRRRPDAPSTA